MSDEQAMKLEPGQMGVSAIGYCSNGHLATTNGWSSKRNMEIGANITECTIGMYVDLGTKKITYWLNGERLSNQLSCKELTPKKELHVIAMLDGKQELRV